LVLGRNTPVELSHTGGGINNATSPYTFTGIQFGEPRADRLLVVCVGGASLATHKVTDVTIGNVVATLVIASSATPTPSAIFVAAVPNGTSGDVVVSASQTNGACAIDVFRLLNASIIPFHSSTIYSASISGTTLTAAINTSGGGAVIGYHTSFASPVPTWSTNMTKISGRLIDLGHGSAANNNTTLEGPLTATVIISGTGVTHRSLVLASFGPL